MDWTTLVASIITGILSIGAVAVFMAKYMPAVTKWATIAKDAVETLSDVADALKDANLSADELAKLKQDIANFQATIKV